MPTFASAFAAFIFSAAWMVASSMVAPVLLQPVPMVAIPGYMFAAATSEASGGISLNLPCIPITSLTVSQECVKMAALAVGKNAPRARNDTMEHTKCHGLCPWIQSWLPLTHIQTQKQATDRNMNRLVLGV
jgi:hypothetical protein